MNEYTAVILIFIHKMDIRYIILFMGIHVLFSRIHFQFYLKAKSFPELIPTILYIKKRFYILYGYTFICD
jgi:hypothetical protein